MRGFVSPRRVNEVGIEDEFKCTQQPYRPISLRMEVIVTTITAAVVAFALSTLIS